MTAAAIRRARLVDAAEMARLGGQLGYPTAAEVMAERLAILLRRERHLVAVAADGGRLRGWIHSKALTAAGIAAARALALLDAKE